MNGLQLPRCDLAGAREPAAGCLHKQCLLLSSTGRLAGGTLPWQHNVPSQCRQGGRGFPPACPVPLSGLSSGLAPRGIAVPRVALGPCVGAVFSRAGVGRAGAPGWPGGNRLFPASRDSSWGGKGRAGSHGNGSGRGPWPGSSFSITIRGICSAQQVAVKREVGLDGSTGLSGSQQLWGAM